MFPGASSSARFRNRSVTQARNRWIRMNQTPTTRKDGRPRIGASSATCHSKGTRVGVCGFRTLRCSVMNEEVAAEGVGHRIVDFGRMGCSLKWTFDMQ